MTVTLADRSLPNSWRFQLPLYVTRVALPGFCRQHETPGSGITPSLKRELGIVADHVRNEIDQVVLMNTTPYVDHSQGDSRPARRIGSAKAKPVACLKCFAETPFGSLRAGNITIPAPAQKTFDAEGEALEHALQKSLHLRNEALKSLCSSVRRFRDATIKEECKSDYPHALQALWKALDRAEDLIQS
jgi:hypothetical protein